MMKFCLIQWWNFACVCLSKRLQTETHFHAVYITFYHFLDVIWTTDFILDTNLVHHKLLLMTQVSKTLTGKGSNSITLIFTDLCDSFGRCPLAFFWWISTLIFEKIGQMVISQKTFQLTDVKLDSYVQPQLPLEKKVEMSGRVNWSLL